MWETGNPRVEGGCTGAKVHVEAAEEGGRGGRGEERGGEGRRGGEEGEGEEGLHQEEM